MYIDLIIIIILTILVLVLFKRFSSFVLLMAIIDIFLRILTFIKYNIGLKDISAIISKYLPENMFNIIDNYTSNIKTLNITLKWLFVFLMIIFLSYIVKLFLKNKKL